MSRTLKTPAASLSPPVSTPSDKTYPNAIQTRLSGMPKTDYVIGHQTILLLLFEKSQGYADEGIMRNRSGERSRARDG